MIETISEGAGDNPASPANDLDAARIRISHLTADYETITAAWLRRADADASLLADALHAVRHGRTEVAAEFIERTIGALRGEAVKTRSKLRELHGETS